MKRKDKPDDAETLDEYDFSQGVREKYAQRYAAVSNVVLSLDVAGTFPDSASVNRALRALVPIARNSVSKWTE